MTECEECFGVFCNVHVNGHLCESVAEGIARTRRYEKAIKNHVKAATLAWILVAEKSTPLPPEIVNLIARKVFADTRNYECLVFETHPFLIHPRDMHRILKKYDERK